MKKLLCIFLILFIFTKINSFDFILKDPASSKFNPYDHILLSYSLTLSVTYLLEDIGNHFNIKIFKNRFINSIVSGSMVYIIGYLKERYIDYSYQKTDMNSNAVGISSALISIDLLNIFKRRK
ncbi:hypothetical protein J7L48_03505 [bacterium]|nr:hypothetical protein [bacterium]